MNPVTASETFDVGRFSANNVGIMVTHANILPTFQTKVISMEGVAAISCSTLVRLTTSHQSSPVLESLLFMQPPPLPPVTRGWKHLYATNTTHEPANSSPFSSKITVTSTRCPHPPLLWRTRPTWNFTKLTRMTWIWHTQALTPCIFLHSSQTLRRKQVGNWPPTPTFQSFMMP